MYGPYDPGHPVRFMLPADGHVMCVLYVYVCRLQTLQKVDSRDSTIQQLEELSDQRLKEINMYQEKLKENKKEVQSRHRNFGGCQAHGGTKSNRGIMPTH